MGSEVLLYGYGIVCLSMLVFNIVYTIILRQGDHRLNDRIRILSANVKLQLPRLREGMVVDGEHFDFLWKRLSTVSGLIAFDRVLDEYLPDKNDPAAREYFAAIQPVMVRLAVLYGERDSMQAAYFAYFLAKHLICESMDQSEQLQSILVSYMKKESLYCHVNALQALCGIGGADSIIRAIRLLDRRGSELDGKILTDELLMFSGSHEELISLLWDNFESFSLRIQLAILNYIRFRTGDYCDRMLQIMTTETADKELRICAIRYFGRYHYEPAREPLLALAVKKEALNWEYQSISVASLADYEGEDVVEALTQALHSPNWYVRYNAAISLEAHHLNYSDLIDIVGGDDRYAREMMMYRLDFQRREEQAWEEELL